MPDTTESPPVSMFDFDFFFKMLELLVAAGTVACVCYLFATATKQPDNKKEVSKKKKIILRKDDSNRSSHSGPDFPRRRLIIKVQLMFLASILVEVVIGFLDLWSEHIPSYVFSCL